MRELAPPARTNALANLPGKVFMQESYRAGYTLSTRSKFYGVGSPAAGLVTAKCLETWHLPGAVSAPHEGNLPNSHPLGDDGAASPRSQDNRYAADD